MTTQYRITSVKHEDFAADLATAIERAIEANASLQPSYGVQVEDIDGNVVWDSEEVAADEIRYSADGTVCMVYRDGEPERVPTQADVDMLPLGDDLTAEDIAGLDG